MRRIVLIIIMSFQLVAYAQKANPELYVFVGEKIELKRFSPEPVHKDSSTTIIIMDEAFKAKYRVLDWVYGDLKLDTIEFEAYDHYGTPGFAEYSHVLLYLEKKDGKLYHSKYQYNPLYQTAKGKWAAPYSTIDYGHTYNMETEIKPEKIEFARPVIFDLSKMDSARINMWFPEPYYRREANKAIVIYGNYVNQLFQLKKDGVLKARGYSFN